MVLTLVPHPESSNLGPKHEIPQIKNLDSR